MIQSVQPMTVTLGGRRQLIEPLYSGLRLIRISGDNQVSPEWGTQIPVRVFNAHKYWSNLRSLPQRENHAS